MLVGLIDIEPKIQNTALMQIAFWHRADGDVVEWAAPLEYDKYDKLYCSSLFDFTEKSQVPARAVCGGTGFDINSRLPSGIDADALDYSIYPECQTSYLWFSRGCIRNCPFCIVRQKEGGIETALTKNLNPNGEYITVMDNNFFANPEWVKAISSLKQMGKPVDFQGVDVRIMNPEMACALNELKHHKQIKMAWDNPKHDLVPYFENVIRHIKPYKIMVYVLIGYWSTPEEDIHRVVCLRNMGLDPYVMPYNKKDYYQKRFARWVNNKAVFKSVKWKDYK